MAFNTEFDSADIQRALLHPGQVYSSKDPEHRGRVQAIVPGFWEGPNSPWIIPVGFPGAGGPPGGGYTPSRVGASIVVGFLLGDLQAPYFMAGPPALQEAPAQVLAQPIAELDKIHVYETDTFEIIIKDDSEAKKIIFRTKTGNNQIELDANDKSVTVQADNSLILKGAMVSVEGVKIQLGGRVVLPVGPPI